MSSLSRRDFPACVQRLSPCRSRTADSGGAAQGEGQADVRTPVLRSAVRIPALFDGTGTRLPFGYLRMPSNQILSQRQQKLFAAGPGPSSAPFATYTSIAGLSFPRFLLDVALTVDGLDSSLLRKDDMRHSMLKTAVRSALFSLCLLGCAVPASAATYYVRKTGNDSQAGTTPGTAFATIKKAATVAKNGDTVYVGKGQYADDVSVKNVNASVVPLRFYADTSGTMTGDGAGDVVFTAAANLTVENSKAIGILRLQDARQNGMEVLIDSGTAARLHVPRQLVLRL